VLVYQRTHHFLQCHLAGVNGVLSSEDTNKHGRNQTLNKLAHQSLAWYSGNRHLFGPDQFLHKPLQLLKGCMILIANYFSLQILKKYKKGESDTRSSQLLRAFFSRNHFWFYTTISQFQNLDGQGYFFTQDSMLQPYKNTWGCCL